MAFAYYGGKYSHLNWLLPLLPECKHFVEPYGGSAAVLLNRAPSGIETFNDLEGDVVNFFQVLRERTEDLVNLIQLTPHSRAEFKLALEPTEDTLERARRFYVLIRQSRNARLKQLSSHSWSYTVNPHSGRSLSVQRWWSRLSELEQVAERLRNVQLEQEDAHSVILRYDSPNTLFYADPPYLAGGGYKLEMGEEEHAKLAQLLNSIQGRVALSAQEDSRLDEWYKGWRVERSTTTSGRSANHANGYSNKGKVAKVQELLLCNW